MGHIFPNLNIARNCREGVCGDLWIFSAVRVLHLQVRTSAEVIEQPAQCFSAINQRTA